MRNCREIVRYCGSYAFGARVVYACSFTTVMVISRSYRNVKSCTNVINNRTYRSYRNKARFSRIFVFRCFPLLRLRPRHLFVCSRFIGNYGILLAGVRTDYMRAPDCLNNRMQSGLHRIRTVSRKKIPCFVVDSFGNEPDIPRCFS